MPDLEPPADAAPFVLSGPDSLLVVKVYRGGRLARLGHNHVISSRDLTGRLWLTPDGRDSVFDIRLPVTTMEVDNPDLRTAAGEDFPLNLSADDIQGTRRNMLGEQQLFGARWPEIRIAGRAVSDSAVDAWFAVQENVHQMTVLATVEREGDQVTVSGAFELKQTALGLEPFSALMGGLTVQDRMEVEFTLRATAGSPLSSQRD